MSKEVISDQLKSFGVESSPSKFTPMVKQYLDIKSQNPDVILLFRLGDFYEMFFNDAKIASQELQLFLTKKSAGDGVKIPMCGIPHHAYLSYAQKLLDNGHKIAIVEQLENPALVKGLVKRGVIQIITPGANLDLKTSDNNFIASIEDRGNIVSLAYADLSTGEIFTTNLLNDYREIISKLLALDIKEIVLPTTYSAEFIQMLKENTSICVSYSNDSKSSFEIEPLFVNLKDEKQIIALSRLMNYLRNTQKRALDYFKPALCLIASDIMKLDYSTLNNLELLKSSDGKSTYGSLYWLLNHCATPMGSRFLKSSLEQPLANLDQIKNRQDAVTWLVNNYIEREDLITYLSNVYDLDRLIARISYGSTNGHDMLQLKKSLQQIPNIKAIVDKSDSILLKGISNKMDYFEELISKLEAAIRDDCPLTITEGGIIKKGYDQSLDELIEMTSKSKEWINRLETEEKQKTGIKNLRVGYTKAFGYYIEVSKGNISEIKPEYGYIRKQTLTTGERYTTQELQDKESTILHADELRMEKEYQIFQSLRCKIKEYTTRIQGLSNAISVLDFLCSISVISSGNGYVLPTFSLERIIDIKNARHPVIEKAQPEKEFVSNDYHMDKNDEVLIITGPNMGGKSTYMREFALISIMAQIGMYVPCESCLIPVFDAIFTRIGASDDLIKGQSTFMVEMQETNKALRQATSMSLILFDEIGRGTATYDGMALAQAILEFDIAKVHAKTLFSTHYHELTILADKYKEMRNVHVSVKENNGKITFLYKVNEGPMDKSYGINVAQLANLPNELIQRATAILNVLEELGNKAETIPNIEVKKVDMQESPVIQELKNIDPLNLSPLDALQLVFKLHDEVKIK